MKVYSQHYAIFPEGFCTLKYLVRSVLPFCQIILSYKYLHQTFSVLGVLNHKFWLILNGGDNKSLIKNKNFPLDITFIYRLKYKFVPRQCMYSTYRQSKDCHCMKFWSFEHVVNNYPPTIKRAMNFLFYPSQLLLCFGVFSQSVSAWWFAWGFPLRGSRFAR